MRTFSRSSETLAQLFRQLAQLEAAGLPATRAFELVDVADRKLRVQLQGMQRQLHSGKSVAEAGFKLGVFDETQHTIIHAAEIGGQLGGAYRQLATHYERLAKRLKKIRSQLILPILVLIIALFVQPLPTLIVGQLTLGHYLAKTVGRLFVLAVISYSVLQLPRWFQRLGLKALWDKDVLKIPLLNKWLIKRQLNEFYFLLVLLLDAGLPFNQALSKAVSHIENTALRAQFATALKHSHSGASVANTLALVPIVSSATLALINTGEQSGTLAHFNQIDAETIALQDDALAEWLPRIVYVFITAWMAYSIVGSGAFMPKVVT